MMMVAAVSDHGLRAPTRPSGPRWRRLVAEVRSRRSPCCRCGQVIDYSLTYPDVNSFSVDHYPFPWSSHPQLAEDPGNLAAAHLHCNKHAQDGPPGAGLGSPSERW